MDTVNICGRVITNMRFGNDIDGLAGSEEELKVLIGCINRTAKACNMKINADRMKVMMNSAEGISREIKVNNACVEVVHQFKYVSSIVTDEGSKPEVLFRIAQTMQARERLKAIWKDQSISKRIKIELMQTLVFLIFLYVCETWTLMVEMRCFCTVLKSHTKTM